MSLDCRISVQSYGGLCPMKRVWAARNTVRFTR